jgi:4-amino-4-deoxy-L-arabinose transferase-like glycosyltransferase
MAFLVVLSLAHVLAAALLALLAYVYGRTLTRGLPRAALAEEIAFSIGLGLGVLGLGLFGLGAIGHLDAGGFAVALVVSQPACFGTWREIGRRLAIARRPSTPSGVRCLALPLAAAFALGLYPPTGFDATLYHLPFARAFADHHGLVTVPDRRFPAFPQLVELLFTPLLALGGDTFPHLVEWLSAATAAVAAYAMGARFGSERAGVWSAALWLGNPLVVSMASGASVDLTFALFALLGTLAWALWAETRRTAHLVLAGALLGSAAGTKYLGILVVGMLVLATAVLSARRRRMFAAILFPLVAALTLAPWYLRIYRVTGNPVFPFLSGIFGTGEWGADANPVVAVSAGRDGLHLLVLPLERIGALLRQPMSLLTLPWRAAFDTAAFNHQAPVSPWYLAVVPAVAVAAFRDRRLAWLALGCLAYTAAWTSIETRYLLPVGALLAIAGGIVLDRVLPARPRTWASAVVALLLVAPGAAYGGYRLRKQGAVPSDEAGRAAYLGRQLGDAYTALHFLNERRGSQYTVYALHAENLAYFAKGRFLGEWVGPARFEKVLPALGDGRALHAVLTQLGADHLLVRRVAGVPSEDEFFRTHFRLLLRVPGADLFEILPASP